MRMGGGGGFHDILCVTETDQDRVGEGGGCREERMCVCKKEMCESEGERECVCVCMTERLCVCVCVCEEKRESVCLRKRERERKQASAALLCKTVGH